MPLIYQGSTDFITQWKCRTERSNADLATIDLSIVTMRWGHKQPVPLANWNSPHVCKNWDAVQEWAEKHFVPHLKEPGWLVHPTLGKSPNFVSVFGASCGLALNSRLRTPGQSTWCIRYLASNTLCHEGGISHVFPDCWRCFKQSGHFSCSNSLPKLWQCWSSNRTGICQSIEIGSRSWWLEWLCYKDRGWRTYPGKLFSICRGIYTGTDGNSTHT